MACIIPGCQKSPLEKVSLHCFPTNESRKKAWITSIETALTSAGIHERLILNKQSRVCCKHFAESCYVDRSNRQRARLRHNSVPTIFKFQEQHNCDSSASQKQGTENRKAPPNPWAPGSGGGPPNTGSTTTSSATPNPTSNTGPDVLGSPGMFQQLSENPQLMSNVNTPFVQSMMQNLAANPKLTQRELLKKGSVKERQAAEANKNNLLEELETERSRDRREQKRRKKKEKQEQLQNLLLNPAAMKAIMKIHQGICMLQQIEPNIFNNGTPTMTSPSATPTAPSAFSQLMASETKPPEERSQVQDSENIDAEQCAAIFSFEGQKFSDLNIAEEDFIGAVSGKELLENDEAIFEKENCIQTTDDVSKLSAISRSVLTAPSWFEVNSKSNTVITRSRLFQALSENMGNLSGSADRERPYFGSGATTPSKDHSGTPADVNVNDDSVNDVERVVFCIGKTYDELLKRNKRSDAIVKLQQLSPFPFDLVRESAAKYPTAKLIWAGSMPKEQSYWSYIKPNMKAATSRRIRYEEVEESRKTSKKRYSQNK